MEPIYLDNASTSFPKPPQVAQAMFDYVTGCGCNIGRGGYEGAYQAEETVLRTRQQLCRLFHGPDSRCVAFTKNITESLNVLLKGLLRPGDHVLVSAMEHNAVMRPLTQLTRRGVTFDRIPCRPDGTLMTERLPGLLRENTRAVVMLHASNVCGTLLPAAEVGAFCRENGLLFLLDTAQTAGAFPIDMEAFVADALGREFGIQVRVGLHCAPNAHRTLGTFPTGAIRFSFGPYNTPGQVDRALEALDALCRRTVWL